MKTESGKRKERKTKKTQLHSAYTVAVTQLLYWPHLGTLHPATKALTSCVRQYWHCGPLLFFSHSQAPHVQFPLSVQSFYGEQERHLQKNTYRVSKLYSLCIYHFQFCLAPTALGTMGIYIFKTQSLFKKHSFEPVAIQTNVVLSILCTPYTIAALSLAEPVASGVCSSIDLCLGLHTGCLIQGTVTEGTVRLHCVVRVAHTHTTLTYPISLGR